MFNEAFCLWETIKLSDVKIAFCYFSVKDTQLCGRTDVETQIM